MRILSLDLSTKSTGWCIGQNQSIISHGYITASSKDVMKRIIKMRDKLSKIIKDNKIQKIIMQQVRLQLSSHTSKVLMWLQGIVVMAIYEINPKIEYDFIGASTWRAALKIKQGPGIKRNNLKPQDIQYVKNKYNITVNDDQADAICIFDAYNEKFNNEINWE